MLNENTAGASSSSDQDAETDAAIKDQETADTQTDENEESDGADDQSVKLPKNQKELDRMLQDRLSRQKKTLEKKHQADLKQVTELKDKSELEIEKKRAEGLTGKISDKNFLIAVKDAGANPVLSQKLLLLYRADFETDDDGEITNLEDVMESAKKDFGDYFKANGKGSSDGGAGGDSNRIKDPVKEFNDSIKRELGY